MLGFTKRCLLVFFRDKSSVFFSMLAPFIVIGLYVLFLGDAYISSFDGMDAKIFMDNWIMAGLLTVTSFTATLGAFATMIVDKTRNLSKDLYASPIPRRKLAGGYLLSSAAIGFIMTAIALVLAYGYIILRGGSIPSALMLLKILGILIVTVFCNTSVIFFIVSFISSENAYSTASTIIGTVIGFITGIYLPMGNLPSAVQWVVRLFPPSHSAALLRQTMMKESLDKAFANAPDGTLAETEDFLGVTMSFGGDPVSPAVSLIILAACGIVFFLLATAVLSRKRKIK